MRPATEPSDLPTCTSATRRSSCWVRTNAKSRDSLDRDSAPAFAPQRCAVVVVEQPEAVLVPTALADDQAALDGDDDVGHRPVETLGPLPDRLAVAQAKALVTRGREVAVERPRSPRSRRSAVAEIRTRPANPSTSSAGRARPAAGRDAGAQRSARALGVIGDELVSRERDRVWPRLARLTSSDAWRRIRTARSEHPRPRKGQRPRHDSH